MNLFKTIAFLLLLLTGSTGWSFPDPPSSGHTPEIPELVSRDYTGPLHEISESTLTVFSSSHFSRFFSATVQDYSYYSSHATRLAAHHFDLRQDISPGFDIRDIIFPFHYFF